MPIVTVEGFARHAADFEGHAGYVYSGEGWLFRFVTESAENFFHIQLPYLIDVLKIDSRQIHRLVLYGHPGYGLGNVCLYVSFEQPPTEGALGLLQITPPLSDVDHSGDILDELLVKLLLVADEPVKKTLSDAMVREPVLLKRRLPKNNTRHGTFIGCAGAETHYGTLTRVQWTDELSPRGADWNKLNFILSEALVEDYNPKNIVRFEFRGIPETEHAYEIEAEVLVTPSIEFRPIRTKPTVEPPTLGGSEGIKDGRWVIHLAPEPTEQLSEGARAIRQKFNRLPLDKRIRVWQSHMAEFFS
jgi:hypothetical protein